MNMVAIEPIRAMTEVKQNLTVDYQTGELHTPLFLF